MKNVITLILALSVFESFAQLTCIISESASMKSASLMDSYAFIPDGTTPVKNIHINIHYILRAASHPNYPGNFTKNSDGNGNSSYTGYDYANDLIKRANEKLSINEPMNMPPSNNTPVIQRKYRFVLSGVFFHESDYYYTFSLSKNPHYTFKENAFESINVYLTGDNTAYSGGGFANLYGERYVVMEEAWNRYIFDLTQTEKWQLSTMAHSLIHETGHNLSLHHTIRTSLGACSNNANDYCSDTPTRGEIISSYGIDPCCSWGGGVSCDNNVMDYTGHEAVTPEQLGRVHYTIENDMKAYKTCYYLSSQIDLFQFIENKTLIAEKVSIPTESNILVNNSNSLMVFCEEFEINGQFEVELGSQFTVTIEPKCN